MTAMTTQSRHLALRFLAKAESVGISVICGIYGIVFASPMSRDVGHPSTIATILTFP
jgi:hypothetical protein